MTDADVIKRFRKVWKIAVEDYLYAKDAFDLELRNEVARDEIQENLLSELKRAGEEAIKDRDKQLHMIEEKL